MKRERISRYVLGIAFTLLFLGPPVFRVGLPGGAIEGSPTALTTSHWLHIAGWVMGGVAAFLFISSGQRGEGALELLRGWPVRWYLFFVGLASLSILYSSSPLYTGFFAGKLLVAILIVVALASVYRSETAKGLFRTLYGTAYVGVVLEILLLFLRPDLVGVEFAGIGFRLYGGIFADYGGFVSIAGLGLLVVALYGRSLRSRILAWIAYGMTWYVLVLSRTRSSIIAALAILAIMAFLHSRLSVRIIAGYVGIVAVFLVVTSESVREPLISVLLRGQTIPVVLDLSGRVDAFTYGLQVWHESPWLGYGFGSGSTAVFARYASLSQQGIGAAHDALSKVLLDLGLIGAFVLGVCIISALIATVRLLANRRRRTSQLESVQCLALLAWALARSVVGGGVADVSLPFVVAMVAARTIELQVMRPSDLGIGRGRQRTRSAAIDHEFVSPSIRS